MIDLKATLGQDHLDAFMRGLVRRRYHALLGAGASFGGTSSDGRYLPGAEGLATELQDAFALPPIGAAGLRRLYAGAKGKTTTSGVSLDAYLKARFSNTTPPDWMECFAQVPWEQIWTLNIDDCVEVAYTKWSQIARQSAVSISWTEQHRTPRATLDETLVIHLHGKASKAHRDPEIVFDIAGYVNATLAQHRWHRIFGDVYPAKPFIIIGASLDSEFDLQVVLEQGRYSTPDGHPSVIVSKDIDAFQADEYRRYGLIPIASAADEFFSSVLEILPQYLAELTHEEASAATDHPREIFTFLNQWQRLESAPPGPNRDRRHDFYAGHSPEWRDILLSLPSERDRHTATVDRSLEDLKHGEHMILLISGDPFTGKSTFLLSIASEINSRGYEPYLYAGEEAIDIHSAAWWLQRYPRSVLLIDDASDFAHDIEKLNVRLDGTPIALRAILTERASRARHIDNVLAAIPHDNLELNRRLSVGEVSRLIDKLTEKKRLGSLTGKAKTEQRRYFEGHKRELFSSMAELEHGRGFVSRIKDEYAAIADAGAQRLLGVIAIVGNLGYELPAPLVKAISGRTPLEAEAMVSVGELADLVAIRNRRGFHLRHRILGTLLVEHCLDPEERFELAKSLAIALAPHVSRSAITANTVHYRITRALMTAQNLKRFLGSNIDVVLDWYDAVEAGFEWNARFWEQRALAAADAGYFEPAYSWAREAVARHEDSFTLNTVGTVLMQRAASEALGGQWPTDSFELAESALAQARDLEGAVSEYPYETFFRYFERLVTLVEERDRALNEQLRNVWMNWHSRVLSLEPSYRTRLNSSLKSAWDAWERTTQMPTRLTDS
ncbi:SIR2 family protein [Micromonospora sp. WMMD967]|uniref:P-loop NTPase n=1 Tax=Micromonospora sp. WMMD967 TaxID=3016101 RepID=UPI0024168F88|nr:SIR2 family protein [Micromonospora sp. WMMD967]MDG4838302.1 SIR2 family protein [Micromonospora sp. WMMD967]